MKFSIFCLIFGFGVIPTTEPAFVDPQYKLVEWTGWGTSLARFGNVLGGFNQTVQDEINYALFSAQKLNLNVLRYTIGATTPGDRSCGEFLQGADIESFKDGPNEPYNWTRDSRARKVLLAAKELGADTFEAFAMSPPSWLTRTGCTKGNSEGAPLHDNFDPVNADEFADYLTEVVKHYHENYNVTFLYLAPFKEPSSGFGTGHLADEEGCNMEKATMVEVIKSVYASLQAKYLTFCRSSVADEAGSEQEAATQTDFTDADLARLYTKITLKGTSNSNVGGYTKLSMLSDRNRHVLWINKMMWGRSPLEDMEQGLSLAERVVYDLRNLVPSAWVYWQAMEEQESNKHGLLELPYHNATVENIHYNSGYFAMMQFSKYIRKGFTIIHVNNDNSVAAYDESSQTLVIVSVNSGSSTTRVTFDLRTFSSLGQVQAFRTSPDEPHLSIAAPSISGNHLSSEFPAKSVTTFKISRAIPIITSNLILNGDFESSGDVAWFTLHGSRADYGINGNYTRHGRYSGYLDFTESELFLMQNVTLTQSKMFYLSAWCSAYGPTSEFGVLINGHQGPALTINGDKGYQLYGLSFDGQEADVISIYIYSEQGDMYAAQIDDVKLH